MPKLVFDPLREHREHGLIEESDESGEDDRGQREPAGALGRPRGCALEPASTFWASATIAEAVGATSHPLSPFGPVVPAGRLRESLLAAVCRWRIDKGEGKSCRQLWRALFPGERETHAEIDRPRGARRRRPDP